MAISMSFSRMSDTTTGIFWMFLTGVLFVCVTGIVRYIGSDIPAAEAAFLRYVAGLIMILPFVRRELGKGITRATLKIFVFRGVVHSLGVALWFYAMARIPIAEVTAIGYTAPIFVTLGAAVFLGERLQTRRIIAVGIAFFGAMIVIRPGFEHVSIGQLAQLCAAPLFAASYLSAKKLSDDTSPTMIVVMLSVFVTIGLAPLAFVVWQTPSVSDVGWLSLVALFATVGHWTMTKAMKAAPLTVTQPVTFLQLVWASLLGYFAFSEELDFFVLLGGGIIIASVTFISYREARIRRKTSTPLAPATKG